MTKQKLRFHSDMKKLFLTRYQDLLENYKQIAEPQTMVKQKRQDGFTEKFIVLVFTRYRDLKKYAGDSQNKSKESDEGIGNNIFKETYLFGGDQTLFI